MTSLYIKEDTRAALELVQGKYIHCRTVTVLSFSCKNEVSIRNILQIFGMFFVDCFVDWLLFLNVRVTHTHRLGTPALLEQ